MAVNYKFVDNSRKLLDELDRREVEVSNEWGKLWQSIASKLITQSGAVDTGRLRASLSYITYSGSGNKLAPTNETLGKDYLNGKTNERGELIVGTNVSYSTIIEIGGKNRPARPYVLPAIAKYREQYKKLMVLILMGKK